MKIPPRTGNKMLQKEREKKEKKSHSIRIFVCYFLISPSKQQKRTYLPQIILHAKKKKKKIN